MRRLFLALPAGTALFAAACSSPSETPAPPLTGNWALEKPTSRLSFVTVKAGQVVEAHHFETLTGSVSADGTAKLDVNLASVKTGVDLRDQRMRDILFDVAKFPEAHVTMRIDPALVNDMAIGAQTTLPVGAALSLHGQTSEIQTSLAVTRIAADKIRVETTQPIILDADSFALGDGLAELQKLAGLPSITAQVPVTFSLTFDKTSV